LFSAFSTLALICLARERLHSGGWGAEDHRPTQRQAGAGSWWRLLESRFRR